MDTPPRIVKSATGRLVNRYRFHLNGEKTGFDSRPVIWPTAHPWWLSAQSWDGSIIVAYCESEEELLSQWPEAYEIQEMSTGLEGYMVSDRFPLGDWDRAPEDLTGRLFTKEDVLHKELSEKSDTVDLSTVDELVRPIVEHLIKNTKIVTLFSCQGHPLLDGASLSSAYLTLSGTEEEYLFISRWMLEASAKLREVFEEPFIMLELAETLTLDEKGWYPTFTLRSETFGEFSECKIYHDVLLHTLKRLTA